jgi:hypothetical protein
MQNKKLVCEVEVQEPHDLSPHFRPRYEEPEWECGEFWNGSSERIIELLLGKKEHMLPCSVSISDPEDWVFEFDL